MNGTLVPAYGRDYKSKAAALADWNAGKDFDLRSLAGVGYINRPQAESLNLASFQIRWKHLTEAAVINRPAKGGDWK